jgi:SAM-dependent methyltransferase
MAVWRERRPPSAQDWEKWQAINHDLVDWLYGGLTGRFQVAGHQLLARWATRYAKQVVVEVGCGHGHHLRYGDNHYAQYIGLDVEYKFLQTLGDRFPGRLVVQGDAYALPFQTASVDCVLAVYNLEHLRQLSACLNEIQRILKPTGELLIGLPAEGGLLYELGRRFTSKRYMEKKYGIDYLSVVRWEHWNTYIEVVRTLQEQFSIVERSFIPFHLLPTVHVNVIGCLRARPQKTSKR